MGTIVSDRESVIERAREHLAGDGAMDTSASARRALRDQYHLADQDGIWGGSEAAVCMGFDEHGEDVDPLDAIVESVAAALK